jgi:hypothetical protein
MDEYSGACSAKLRPILRWVNVAYWHKSEVHVRLFLGPLSGALPSPAHTETLDVGGQMFTA